MATPRRIEATGGPAACARCGRAAPEGDDPRWAGRLERGRLVAVVCPDCLAPEERAEVLARGRAPLYEVVAGRRAAPAALHAVCDPGWLARLDGDPIGVVVEEGDAVGADVRVAWVATADGRPTAWLSRMPLAAWAALEEVFVPPAARALARRLAAEFDGTEREGR
jgi:hypothetical protein